MSDTCDVVLGMGTCGEDAALRPAGAGLDVVGIEPRLIGGEFPYWACIPSKFMVRSANLVRGARQADGLVGRLQVEPYWSTVASRIRSHITGGAYGRGIRRVLAQDSEPMFGDPTHPG